MEIRFWATAALMTIAVILLLSYPRTTKGKGLLAAFLFLSLVPVIGFYVQTALIRSGALEKSSDIWSGIFYFAGVSAAGCLLAYIGVIRPPGQQSQSDSEFTFALRNSASNLTTPKLCPCCSQPATERVEVRAYTFESSTGEMIMFGLLGQLFKFVAFGSSSRALLPVFLCRRCHSSVVTFKTLEWAARIGGIALTVVLLVTQTSPEQPLIKRGAGPILLTLLPLVLGAILAYLFRSSYEESKGVALIRTDSTTNWFRGRSKEWVRDFRAANPEAGGSTNAA